MQNDLEIKESDLEAYSKDDSKDASEVFNQFIKTIKAKLVYPSTSKLPQQFLENMFK